jgi:hypothetical protein
MAWGDLARDGLYKRLSWSQNNRWYWWKSGSDFGHDDTFVVRWSSNTHIIPATRNLERAAMSLKRGRAAELSGDLVRVDAKKGERTYWWVSSMSRTDGGDGSCEVLYLRELKAGGKVFR